MRVYVDKPELARRLRLEGDRFGAAAADEFLSRRPTLVFVEAQDRKYNFTTPVAYSRYGRGEDGKVVSTLMDAVVEVPSGFNVMPAPSEADYVLSFAAEERAIRTRIERYTLRRSDGVVVGTTTRIAYEWTDPKKTLLARTAIDECGNEVTDYRKLVELIAPAR